MLSNRTVTGREGVQWPSRMQVGVGGRAESCRVRKPSCSRLVEYSGMEFSRRSYAGCLANMVGGAFDCIGLSWGLQWSFVTDGRKHGLWIVLPDFESSFCHLPTIWYLWSYLTLPGLLFFHLQNEVMLLLRLILWIKWGLACKTYNRALHRISVQWCCNCDYLHLFSSPFSVSIFLSSTLKSWNMQFFLHAPGKNEWSALWMGRKCRNEMCRMSWFLYSSRCWRQPVCLPLYELTILFYVALRFVSFYKAIPKNPGATISTRRSTMKSYEHWTFPRQVVVFWARTGLGIRKPRVCFVSPQQKQAVLHFLWVLERVVWKVGLRDDNAFPSIIHCIIFVLYVYDTWYMI